MNEVMFTGESPFVFDADLQRYADAAVLAFLTGYGPA